jgi:DNA-binding NtrC family response regulator
VTDESSAPVVLILNRDLFFGVRLRQALTADGWAPKIVPNTAKLTTELGAAADVALVIVDMATAPDWSAVVSAAAAHVPEVPVLAFGAHRDVDRFRAAKAAGVTRVVSNGDFHRDMIGFVRRYASHAPASTTDAMEPAATDGRTGEQADLAGSTTP